VRSLNWLEVFDSGELIFDKPNRKVCYRLSARQFVLSATAAMAFGIILWWGAHERPAVIPVFLSAGWLIVVPGGLAGALSRFRRFLSNAILTTPKARAAL
jgi:hypothetical protein